MTPIIHPRGLGKAGHRRRRCLGLDKDFDDTKFTPVKRVVQLGHIFEWNPMCDHERRVELSGDDILVENLSPVRMNRGWRRISQIEYSLRPSWQAGRVFLLLTLSIPNQSDPFFHDRSNVQSVCEPSVGSDNPDPSELLDGQERLVQGLARIGLQRQRFTDLMHDSLGLMESGSVNGDVQPVGDEFFGPLGHVGVG